MTAIAPTDFDSELRRHNDVLTRASDIRFADHVLDIGCGTGQTTRHSAQTARDGSALGIDISGPAIERARSAASTAGITNVHFEHADAQTYPFTRDHFDVALSRFGTMFFEDPAAAFANIRRSLRPGGRLVMMVWQSRDRNEWIVAIDRALNAAQTVTDPMERSNPFSLGDPAGVTALLEGVGFADVAFTDVTEPVFYGADTAAALDWIFGFAHVTDMLNRMDPVARDRAVRALEETVAAHAIKGGVWFASRAWIVTARTALADQSHPSAHASPSHAPGELMVTVGDIDLCVQTFGNSTAPALLLISGAESSMDWWDDEFCEALAAAGRHVIRYDTRDTGRSTTFPPGRPPYGGEALIDDAVGLLSELGIAAAHVVGISMGGGIAQVLAVRYPELVLSLTLIATSPGGQDLPSMSPRLAEQMGDGGQPEWSNREAVIAYYIGGEHMLAGTIPVDEERMRRIVGRVWGRSPSIASGQNHWQLSGGEPVRDRLGEITAPTLVLHGIADPLFPLGHGEALAREIHRARLVPLSGMGHQMPPPELWGSVIPAILSISELDRS